MGGQKRLAYLFDTQPRPPNYFGAYSVTAGDKGRSLYGRTAYTSLSAPSNM